MTPDMLPWESVRLAPLDHIPVERLVGWQNDSRIRDRIMGFRFPVDGEAVSGWLAGKRSANGKTAVTFAILSHDEAVGVAYLNNLDWLHRHAQFGIYIGNHGRPEKGIGFCASSLVLDFAFRGIGLNRVGLAVLANNEAALKLYDRLGFQNEGVSRQSYFYNGSFMDVVNMAMLSENWNVALPSSARNWCDYS